MCDFANGERVEAVVAPYGGWRTARFIGMDGELLVCITERDDNPVRLRPRFVRRAPRTPEQIADALVSPEGGEHCLSDCPPDSSCDWCHAALRHALMLAAIEEDRHAR